MTPQRPRLKALIAFATASVVGCGGGGNDPSAPSPSQSAAQQACDTLVGKTLGGGVVTKTELAAYTDADPEHCRVTGRIAGSDINFVAKLPTTWNGKAQMTGSGGFQGALAVAATTPLGLTSSALSKGYVDYITDSGHSSSDIAWFLNDEALTNFAGLSHQRVTLAVQAIMKEHYGKDAERTYFQGCSGAGHIALVMAQRFPRLFDGIIAAAPAPNFVGTFLGWQKPVKALAVPGAVPSQAKLTTLARAVRQQCDKLDGVEDGIVSNPLACSFDPEPLRCTGSDHDGCLNDAQMNYVREQTRDIQFQDGSLLVKGLRLVGAEDDPGNWLQWQTPSPSTGESPFYRNVKQVVQVLTRDVQADPLTYSISEDELNIKNLSRWIDAWPANLSEFGAAGRKLIIWNGTADTPVPFENQIVYHDAAVASLGGPANAQQTLRTFFPPGVNHCGIGKGAGVADYLVALDVWVTKNQPPDHLIASNLDADGKVTMTRPLCAYPTWPRYKGSGDVNNASSFTCVE